MAKDLTTTNQEIPDYLKNSMNSNRGADEVSFNDCIIPRIEMIQSLSPAKNKQHALYIQGADEGNMFNSVTRELYGDNIDVTFVYFMTQYLLWKDRKKGGGLAFVGNTQQEALDFKATLKDGEDYEIVQTSQHYVLLVGINGVALENPITMALSMAKSKAKISKQINTILKMNGGDTFSRVYRLKSIQEQNKNGDYYYNFAFTPTHVRFPTEKEFKLSEEAYNSAKSGKAVVSSEFDPYDVNEKKQEF